MYLGIEIGGTKLQFGVGPGDGQTFTDFVRRDVVIANGGEGIRQQIAETGRELVDKHRIRRIAYGFGGPVFGEQGIVQRSHQVDGWDQFPLVEWTQRELGVPTRLGNDCDVAALAEATYGAGRRCRSLFYVTVGTGIGGGLVIDRKIHGTDRPAAAEIGHLRVGLEATASRETVESIAAGPAIASRVQRLLHHHVEFQLANPEADQLLQRCLGRIEQLTTKQIADAAANGNHVALQEYDLAALALGWGLAQMITLIAPEIVVVGGGVSMAAEHVFLTPLRDAVRLYVFPPLVGTYQLVPAALGEAVVVHGALALAAAG